MGETAAQLGTGRYHSSSGKHGIRSSAKALRGKRGEKSHVRRTIRGNEINLGEVAVMLGAN